MKILRKLAFTLALGLVTSTATAGYQEVTVQGTAGPWNWAVGGLNSGYAYGPTVQDFTAPARVKLSDIGSGSGFDLFILYESGDVSNFNGCCGGPWGPSGEDTSTYKDDVLGSSGDPFPSFYMPNGWGSNLVANFNSNVVDNPNGLVASPADFGIFLMSLVGVLTDDNGSIVDTPFAIGTVFPYATDPSNAGSDSVGRAFGIGLSFSVPAAATYLNLGVNDDLFGDNGGAFNVCVASSDADITACLRPPNGVPEPATLALLGLGLAGLGLARRKSH